MYAELRRRRNLGARGKLDAQNQDLLWLPRSAVVAAVSALDAYVHAVLSDRIPQVLRSNPVPDSLCDALAEIIPIKNSNTFQAALPTILASDSVAELSKRYREEKMSFATYQAPDKIIAGYRLIGFINIFEDVSAMWPGPQTKSEDIKRQLVRYVERRNQIAHEGDQDHQGRTRAMTPNYARDCRDFIERLVVRLNRAVYGN